MKCENCGAEVPEVSRFCLSCGKEIPPPKKVESPQQQDPDPNGYAMICFALSFMMFFFALVPIVLGLWIGAVIMAAAGIVLVLVGFLIFRTGKKHIEKMEDEPVVKLKCRYCGSLNDEAALRCEACGATL